jgi:hypothetical protein
MTEDARKIFAHAMARPRDSAYDDTVNLATANSIGVLKVGFWRDNVGTNPWKRGKRLTRGGRKDLNGGDSAFSLLQLDSASLGCLAANRL